MEDNQGKVKNLYLVRTIDGNMYAGVLKQELPDYVTLSDLMIFSHDDEGHSFLRPDPLSDGETEFMLKSVAPIAPASEYLVTTYMKVKEGADLKDLIRSKFPDWNISYAVH